MKLKNILVIAFLTLTLIPIIIASLLLYKSGFGLSKESYSRNLIESINVQEDYISQTIENNMIADYRFAAKIRALSPSGFHPAVIPEDGMLSAFQSYLEASEDKIAVCILLNKEDELIYTIGEKAVLDTVLRQLPRLSELANQTMMEFRLGDEAHSLGIITPMQDSNGSYMGSLISIYDKSYIFKIISSYYKVVNTSIYICGEHGEMISYRKLADEKQNVAVAQVLNDMVFTTEGVIDTSTGDVPVSGYYKNIRNTPWHLVGFIDQTLIHTFTNQFIWVYIFIILGVLIADVILSFYFSQRVVRPINALIQVMEGYPQSLNSGALQRQEKNGYYETRYLCQKFLGLMNRILLVQHNFEGVYQLYQSSDMGDTNIDIDVMQQTISSNKETFEKLMNEVEFSEDDCIIERFTKCFCEKDRLRLINIFENMRDEHLSVKRELEVYTSYLDQKWFHVLVVPMYEGERLSRLFIQLRDITNFKKQEYKSAEEARRDALTGLYNRTGFAGRVELTLQEKEDESCLHGLLFIDMDYFKLVNDNLGHRAGDELLCEVAQILLHTVGADGTVSRFGGDEFAVFLPRTTLEETRRMKDELRKRLVFPYQTKKVSFTVSASIGVSTWSHTSTDTLEKLLQQADDAMYQAKRAFKKNDKR